MMSRDRRRILISLAAFAGMAALALYWPLIHAATHIGATLPTDYYHFHWNYWWMRHAIGHGWTIYETNYVLFPYTTNLAYHTLTPFWFPLWALIEPLIGTFRAMNVIHWLALTLNGWIAFICFRRFGVPTGLALAGGIVFLLSPAALLAAYIVNPNYVTLFWYPLLLLTWREIARASGRRRAILTGLFGLALYGMVMTDLQHLLFAAFLLIPYIGWTLIAARPAHARIRLFASGASAGAIALALLTLAGPLLWILRFDRAELSPMGIEAAGGIPFPEGYLAHLSPYSRLISLGALLVPAALIALIALIVRLARRRPVPALAFVWLIALVPPLILSAGPFITVFGERVATPYVWLHQAFGGLFRSPARFAPIIALSAVLFIGALTAGPPPRWLRRPAARAAIGGALVFIALSDARIFEPMPLTPVAPDYAFYHAIGAETGPRYDDLVVLNVPVAGGTGEAWVGEFPPMETQIYGMIHGKRMLNGSIARAPLRYYWYWLYDDPLLAWLGQRRYLEPAARDQLAERIAEWPIGYVVLHQRYTPAELPTNIEWIGAFNRWADLLCVQWTERDAVVWRTSAHPDFAACPPRTPPPSAAGYTIDLGSPGDERFLGWGWYYAEEVAGITARWLGAPHPAADPPTDAPPTGWLYVDLPAGAYRLTVTAQAYAEDRRLQIAIDGAPVGPTFTVSPAALADYAVDIPADAIGTGRHIAIALAVDAARSPAEAGSADARRLALMIDRVTLTPLADAPR
jgi:hypothetical protein